MKRCSNIDEHRHSEVAVILYVSIVLAGIIESLSAADATPFERVRRIPWDRQLVNVVEFSPDGKLLAVAGCNHGLSQPDQSVALTVFDAATYAEKWSITPRSTLITSAAFTPDAGSIVYSQLDGTDFRYDFAKHVSRELPAGFQLGIRFLPGGTSILGTTGPKVGIVDPDSGELKASVLVDHRGIRDCEAAVSSDGKTLAVTGSDWESDYDVVTLYDLPSMKKRREFSSQTKGVFRVAFIPGQQTLAVGTRTGDILFWDIEAPRLNTTIRACDRDREEWIGILEVSADGRFLAARTAARSAESPLRIWAVRDLRPLGVIEGDISAAAFSPDGDTLVTATLMPKEENAQVHVWRFKPGKAR